MILTNYNDRYDDNNNNSNDYINNNNGRGFLSPTI